MPSIRSDLPFKTIEEVRDFFHQTLGFYRSLPEIQTMEDHDVDDVAQYDHLLHICQRSLEEGDDVLTLRMLHLVKKKAYASLLEIAIACEEPEEHFVKHMRLVTFLRTMEEGFVESVNSLANREKQCL